MTIDSHIRRKLRLVVKDQISLGNFFHWFHSSTWNEDSPLINQITLLWAEWTKHHWTNQELRRKLAEILKD